MSRRFGRNQRRKLKGEVAHLKQVAATHYSDMVDAYRDKDRLEGEVVEWAARVVSLLGPDSAFARELARLDIDVARFQALVEGIPMQVKCPGLGGRISGLTDVVDQACAIVDTFAIYARTDYDVLSRGRRFEVCAPDGRSAVMMDDRTMHDLRASRDKWLARYLLRNLIGPAIVKGFPA